MANLETVIAGIRSPNPFWLASAPPTNSGKQIMRAFDAGWGGAVWKTLGIPIHNVSSRLSSLDYGGGKRMLGLNNIELITDRPIEDNLREMAEVKKRYPKNTLIASLMFETRQEWKEIIRQVQDVGSDGIELNFGCPHGMCERGMGSAVGQEPEVLKKITGWVKEFAKIPVIVKLTPNITDVTVPAEAALQGGADAVSLINTIKSIIQVDIDQFAPYPKVDGKSTNGGYCGPAVKPIALHMVGAIARKKHTKLPISGIGGISNWRDAVEFMLMGASNVQVCTAVMHYGYRIVEDMLQGLSDYMDQKSFISTSQLVGKAVPNFHQIAKIHPEHCIGCNLCVVACHDGAHQCIDLNPEFKSDHQTRKAPIVLEEECVGCNLCQLVCPAPGAITMERAVRAQ
jgi:dihydropyrimidine dehydrogenase (NAD+) subunit PreA